MTRDCDNFVRKPNHEEMVISVKSKGTSVSYRHMFLSAVKIRWESRRLTESDEPAVVREPLESTRKFSAKSPITAAGKKYTSIKQLCATPTEDDSIYRDVYGRTVFCTQMRFPCFDSYDYITENRYYRWFFIKEDNRLTRVYYEDESDVVIVTEDVENLESDCLEQMKEKMFL